VHPLFLEMGQDPVYNCKRVEDVVIDEQVGTYFGEVNIETSIPTGRGVFNCKDRL
jgi:hypothetical protein